MDFERLEQWVLRCPLQEFTFRDESGEYVFGNLPTRPAWWTLGYRPDGQSAWTWHRVRGLKQIITMIEQRYPAFYAWLLLRFPDNGKP